MNVLLAGAFPLPTGSAAASRLVNFSFALQAASVKCCLLGIKTFINTLSDNSTGSVKGIPVITLNAPFYGPILNRVFLKTPFVFKKGILLQFLAKQIHSIASSQDCDLVILYDQDPRLIRAVHKARQHKKWKIIQQYAEYQLPSDFRYGVLNPFYRLQKSHINIAPLLSDGGIAISTFLMRKCSRSSAKLPVIIPALADFDSLPKLNYPSLSTFVTLTYLGAGARRDCLKTIVEAVRSLVMRGFQIKLELAGLRDSAFEKWSAFARMNSFNWLKTRKRISNSEKKDLFEKTDIFLFLRHFDISGIAAFPTRLPEFMASGRPVICSRIGDLPKYISAFSIEYVETNKVQEVIKAMENLILNPEARNKIGSSGAAAAKEAFDYRVYSGLLHSYLHNITDHRV